MMSAGDSGARGSAVFFYISTGVIGTKKPARRQVLFIRYEFIALGYRLHRD
ncbi:hypothetical protein BZ22_1030 [Yersinia pseudotuberculosis YPIII]|uniref:Uncharacterized protein n=1 Tax=Yersinia pseudotuberculosis serotype O:3 (strain YPIII) TaxID=502800 RepID=A0A0H3B016_YERPY|nr:hypothetical protein BZ22_1030 [Yersinia pseudotuberculosis YPIII]